MNKSAKATKLSVIILNYNSGHYLSDCLQSLHLSKLKEKVEIIVVDNASTDNTNKLLKDKNLTLITNKKNFNFFA